MYEYVLHLTTLSENSIDRLKRFRTWSCHMLRPHDPKYVSPAILTSVGSSPFTYRFPRRLEKTT